MSAPTTNGRPAPPAARGPAGAAPPYPVPARAGLPRAHRRSPGLIALAVLLMAGCAAIAGALVLGADDRTEVVVAARDIPAGTQITEEDVAAGELAGSGVAAISGADADALLGQTATTAIPAGALLHADMVARAPTPGAGLQAVGVALAPGRLPAELAAGRDVVVQLVPAGVDAAAGGEAPAGSVLVSSAEVLSVTADPSGSWLVSLAVADEDAADVSAAAAVNRVAVAMLPLGQE